MGYKGGLCHQISSVKQVRSHIVLKLDHTWRVTNRNLQYVCAIHISTIASLYFEEDIFERCLSGLQFKSNLI